MDSEHAILEIVTAVSTLAATVTRQYRLRQVAEMMAVQLSYAKV